MTARVGAEVDQVGELRRVLGRRADDLAEVADDVGATIDRFRARSGEYVPHLPAHRARGAQLAARLDDLGVRVERSRDALVAADRWVTTRIAVTAFDLESGRQTVVGVPRTIRHTAPGTWALGQQWRMDRTTPPRLTNQQVRFGVPGARGLPRDEVVALGRHLNRTNAALRGQYGARWSAAVDWSQRQTLRAQWQDTLADGRRVAGGAPGAGLRVEDAHTGLGRGWATRISSSRVAAVGRLGSRAVGVAGVGLGAVDFVQGVRHHEPEQALTGALSALSGGAMMSGVPPVQLAGAVLAGGLLVYEYRDEIAAAGRAVADGARQYVDQQVALARGAAALAGDTASAAADVAGAAAGAVEDMTSAAWGAVEELF